MVAVNDFVAMVCLFPFVCHCVGDFPYEYPSLGGEFPSPAWPIVAADAVSVDAGGVSCPFEFDEAASQALRRVLEADAFGDVGEGFLCDGGCFECEDGEYVEFWGVH